jgi:peptidoglycan LD-endopeptidase CwlK
MHMINSRKLDDLSPPVRERAEAFLQACAAAGIDLLVTSTYRDHESQEALFAQGRTRPGAKVTNARPGHSWHNWRCAFDVVPLRNGKPVWNAIGADRALWQQVGEIGESCGLEWAARWETFPELAHFQYTGGLTMADFRAGKQLEAA